jgi:hypothetical protein
VCSPCDGDALARSRTVVAVLRLVIGTDGELAHGEVITSGGLVAARFRAWEGLVPALRGWLADEGPEPTPDAEAAGNRTTRSEERP